MTNSLWIRGAANPRTPLWFRVVCYAFAHGDDDGHCRLAPEQLHHDLDPLLPKSAISRAIATAVRHQWLQPTSSARCLVVVGATHGQCQATHREAA